MRFLLLAAALSATAALGGCKSSSTASDGSTAPAAPPSATATGTARLSSCNLDYCEPADWETARAATPLAQIPPFVEPLNVVIGARSTVSLAAIQQALSDWKTVSTATDVTVAGIRLKCISSESADVTGNGYRPQYTAWRLGGCLGGNELSVSGNEDHVRIWNQPVRGSRYGAWFIAASYETMCLVRDGKLQTADANKGYAVLHPGQVYHCVDGGPGSVTTAHKDGYDAAAAAFSSALAAAARARGWHVSERTASAARGASAGEGGVPFGAAVYVVTVTA
jgi:hypothetical protein